MTTVTKIDIDADIKKDIRHGLVLFLDADQLVYRRATCDCSVGTPVTGKHYFVCVGTGLKNESYWIPLTSNAGGQSIHVDFLWRWGCEILGMGKDGVHADQPGLVCKRPDDDLFGSDECARHQYEGRAELHRCC